MTLGEAREHIGDCVLYTEIGRRDVEQGVITSVNDYWVFARFGSDTGSKAVHPADLTLLAAAFGDPGSPRPVREAAKKGAEG